MKSTEAAYVAVAVLFRTASITSVLFGLFSLSMPLVGFIGHFSGEVMLGLLRIVTVYLVAAAVLWIIAKPVASFVTRGLDSEA
jgi:hypothetical protein